MGSLDPAKILVILLVALIVLGPERLPRVARQMGAMWHELSRLRDKVEDEVRGAIPDLDLPAIPKMPKGGVTGYLTGMMATTGAGAKAKRRPAGGRNPNGPAKPGATTGGNGELPGPREAGVVTTTSWQRSGDARPGWSDGASGLPEGVPAGWQSVGAPAPGYASGSLLSPVPTGTGPGTLDAEASFTFDEPSWN